MKTILLLFVSACSLLAATVSTVTCTGGVATVTVANSLVASQGFELTGTSVTSYNINGTAISANASSFTFAASCNGTATGGTFAPAVQIINMGVAPTASGATISYLFWLTTLSPVACPGCTSLYPKINAAQLAAVQAGTTIEQSGSFGITPTETTAQMNTQILGLYTAAQVTVTQGLSQFVGWCYNGAWSASCN
jgi:hypothetical protein